MSIKNNIIKTANKVLTPMRNDINKKTLEATYKAQKKYGFQMGTGPHATWNNEADAFKHTYMQWYMTWHYGETLAESTKYPFQKCSKHKSGKKWFCFVYNMFKKAAK